MEQIVMGDFPVYIHKSDKPFSFQPLGIEFEFDKNERCWIFKTGDPKQSKFLQRNGYKDYGMSAPLAGTKKKLSEELSGIFKGLPGGKMLGFARTEVKKINGTVPRTMKLDEMIEVIANKFDRDTDYAEELTKKAKAKAEEVTEECQASV